MNKAMVIGASGGMGYSLVRELSSRGFAVKAFARTKSKLEKLYSQDKNVEVVVGDVFDYATLLHASKDVDVIFQAANLPYVEWESQLPSFIKQILRVAEENQSKVAFVENIYAYGKNIGTKITESDPKTPHTKKGKIRLEVEKLIKDSNVPSIIAHFPDFYGPNAENTILHLTLNNVVNNKRALFVGDKRIAREYIYTPDGAKALVSLSLCNEAYGQCWNIPGHDVITGEQLIEIIRNQTQYKKSVSTVTKNMIKLLGVFDKNMREVVEMYYLNEDPVILSGNKYKVNIGEIPSTSYEIGIKETLSFMSKNL
ncbi:SDR family NAD(P)-dependent oxidoreductase [Bacillus sp. BGMRC 2118]|nr:SDR family NAD(P)-dependent oxidoreductase [Bacillus sp. BGMRC 2118]